MPQKLRERPTAARSALYQTVAATSVSVSELPSLPRARAIAGPPCRGRSLWAVTVATCPRCGGMHQHRAGEATRLLSGRLVRLCPVTGRPYVLGPVQRQREARHV